MPSTLPAGMEALLLLADDQMSTYLDIKSGDMGETGAEKGMMTRGILVALLRT